jgi:glycerol-3-phosphate dehydrogenase
MKRFFARPDIGRLKTTLFDLIVVGGGITGAGIAQDAASRGMKVLLLEKGDFASGTSSKSTKLIHGGLRYLQNGQVSVVRESLRERQLLMKLAPHLVWSIPFVIPLYRGNFWKNLKLALGLWVYDLLAGFRNRKFHKRISAAEVSRRCPGIATEGLIGGYLYEDCRTDDARHTLEVLKSASEHGAQCVNYARVLGLIHDGCRCNGVVVSIADQRGNWSAPFEVRSRAVVNATSVWTQAFATAVGARSNLQVVPAKGIHITVSQQRLPITSAMIIPSVHDKRFCFAVPWYDSVVIGTTDTEYDGSLDDVRAEPQEVQYVLDAVNAQFPHLHLSDADITGRFAGLRPLVRDPRKQSTADLARGHSLTVGSDGLITIAGGKLTPYRPMASSVVDRVVKQLAWRQKPGRCRTDEIMLGGWRQGETSQAARSDLYAIGAEVGVTRSDVDFLISMYGRRAGDVMRLVGANPTLGRRLHPQHPYLQAQVAYAARCEGALTVDDVLGRRIRLTITDAAAALQVAPLVAYIMGDELDWDVNVHIEQVDRFRAAMQDIAITSPSGVAVAGGAAHKEQGGHHA